MDKDPGTFPVHDPECPYCALHCPYYGAETITLEVEQIRWS
jgi:hypothetical protein